MRYPRRTPPAVRSETDRAEALEARAQRIDALERRVGHLEAALEGLQDAVYRQDTLHDRQIADLRKQEPAWQTRPRRQAPGEEAS